ncbi:MAG: methyltransferase family protein, partial [Candidatus Binatia bacterium]
IERLLETFWNRRKVPGKIVESYTLPALISVHALIYLVTLGSWIAGKQEAPTWMTVTGTTMVLISMVGRNWAIRSLGPYHSIHVEIRDAHPLIQSGAYRFVRNPYYLSNVVEIVGLPLVVGSFLGVVLAGVAYLPLLAARLVIEENALGKKFGDLFASYKARVPRIMPKFF